MKEIVLAGGCFWGVEEYFSRIKGVMETVVGYANGHVNKPTYEQVKKGNTGYAEAVYIKYNNDVISLKEILDKFWAIVDPTMKDQQGPDIGNQYRTGIYFIDSEDLNVIKESLKKEQQKYKRAIVTELEPLGSFYKAEEYHQKYLKKNPGGYCHINL